MRRINIGTNYDKCVRQLYELQLSLKLGYKLTVKCKWLHCSDNIFMGCQTKINKIAHNNITCNNTAMNVLHSIVFFEWKFNGMLHYRNNCASGAWEGRIAWSLLNHFTIYSASWHLICAKSLHLACAKSSFCKLTHHLIYAKSLNLR